MQQSTLAVALVLLQSLWSPDALLSQVSATSAGDARIVAYPAVSLDKPNGLHLDLNASLTITEDAGCVFNRVQGLVQQRSGELVVANAGNRELCFFTPTGSLIRRVGRQGSGPGEYQDITGLELLLADSLLVRDGLQRRLSVLTPNGSYVRSFVLTPPIDTLGSVVKIATLADGTVLVGYSEIRTAAPRPDPVIFNMQLFRYDTQGKLLGRLGRFPTSEHFIQATPREMGGVAYWDRAFGRRLSLIALADGFLAGDGTDFTIAQHSPSGSVVAVHRMEWAPQPVRSADIAVYQRNALTGAQPPRSAVIQKRVDEMPYPARYPAYGRVLGDPSGRIWFEMYPAPGVPTGQWIVFEPGARRTSLLSVPARFRPLAASRSRLCGVTRDELDVESIQCFPVRAP